VARLREAGPVVEKLRTAWVKVSTLGVLRLRAIKRSVQDDVFVGRNAATANLLQHFNTPESVVSYHVFLVSELKLRGIGNRYHVDALPPRRIAACRRIAALSTHAGRSAAERQLGPPRAVRSLPLTRPCSVCIVQIENPSRAATDRGSFSFGTSRTAKARLLYS